jgi:hypothetical protein
MMDFNSKQSVDMDEAVKAWTQEINLARNRLKDYRKEANKVVKLYEADKTEDYQFNILYSNTETMLPALYNSTPRPDVQPRYKVTDKLPNTASQVCKRVLEFLLDTENGDYSKFDVCIESATLEALVPGQGVTRFKYDYTAEVLKSVEAEASESGHTDVKASTASVKEQEAVAQRVTYETICGEEVPWDRVLFGYCKKWKDLPWIAFEHFMNKEELVQAFGAETAAKIPLTFCPSNADSEDENSTKRKDAAGENLAHVYEIWDKSARKVKFMADGLGTLAKEVDDPLQLKHFWPMPQPMAFFRRISAMTPQTLYAFYCEQAKELNTCTVRINMLMKALKVRGFYDSTLDGLGELLKQDDNALIPAENVAAMLQGQTLERAIWFFPIEKLVMVLQQLYLQREQIKQVIYEVTGLSDIIRGSQAASETATASNIKRQWGTIRLKKSQKEVKRFVKDSLRIMAELAFKHLSQETIAKMTGMQLPTKQEQEQARMALEQFQQQAQMQAQQAQATGQQPPPTPQPPAQLQTILDTPAWEDVLAMLQDDIQRDYRIDIEANSTIDEDATEDKADVAEFMNAMGQFLSGTTPLVEKGLMPFEVMKSTLLAITQRFRFGREVEDQIRAMTPPPPPQENAGDQAKVQAAQAQAEADMARLKAEGEAFQAEIQGKMQLMAAELEIKQQELELKRQELAMKGQQLQMQMAHEQQAHAQQMELSQTQHLNAQEAASQKAQVNEQGFVQKMKTMAFGQKNKPSKGE